MMDQSLYERIGGEAAVTATVMKLYDKILCDKELSDFFEHSDVDSIRFSQSAFVTYAFGGPNYYTGKSLRIVHANPVKQGMNDAHFDRVIHHLKTSMQELGVSDSLIEESLAIVESTRCDVLGRGNSE